MAMMADPGLSRLIMANGICIEETVGADEIICRCGRSNGVAEEMKAGSICRC
jgi:hypothetical protein